MDWYPFIRKILFSLDPEKAHDITLRALRWADKAKLTSLFAYEWNDPVELMGLTFKNRVGLAAGFDKNGECIDALASLGFGFIEIGTVTKQPQAGNPKPRLFRLPKDQAIINRMGFNNLGVDALIAKLKKIKYQGILGINIGKNRDTPLEQAIDEYLYCFAQLAPYASYITINVSSPNTQGLRDLQKGEHLQPLLQALKQAQLKCDRYVPLVIKISPDLTSSECAAMADVFLKEKIDGVIATNTTIHREGVADLVSAQQAGGLSGAPLNQRVNEMISQMHGLLQNAIPIIGCGGIISKETAQQKMAAGAKLIQLYTGLVYQGPRLLRETLASRE